MTQTFILQVGPITVPGTKIDAFRSSTELSIMTQAVIIVLYLVRTASRLELIDNSRGTRYPCCLLYIPAVNINDSDHGRL